ncbi:MAG: hypothetical protein GF308_20845 [Candidatus Heimdallarchaeota archaeon]|nr:hypothetical protein [Candidatus Heimdallarchaeota archaeon]
MYVLSDRAEVLILHMKTSKLLWIIPIFALIITGNCLAISAKQIPEELETSPDLFDIGTFNLEIEVSETEFTPATFTVKESATVNLTVKSVDVAHTFEIEEYGINEDIPANGSVVIDFVASKVGTFTYSSESCSATGTMIVEDPYVPGLPRPENITILIDVKHSENVTAASLNFANLEEWGRDNNFTVEVNTANELVEGTLDGVDVLIILDATEDFTEFEIEDVLAFVRNGGGLLFGGTNRTALTNAEELTKPFGFTFANATAAYINATTVNDPIGENNTLPSFLVTEFMDEHPLISEEQYVPLTQEIISHINYTGSLLRFNETWASERLANDESISVNELIDCYIIANGNETIFADDGDWTVEVNETIGAENVFLVGAETTNNGRVIGLGSGDIINESQTGRNPENEIFFQRAIQWLAKMYAVIDSYNYSLSTFQLKRGDSLIAQVKVFAQNFTELNAINVTLKVWRLERIEKAVELEATNASYFEGMIDTTGINKGTVYINTIAHKRGYGYNYTKPIYLQIYPDEPEPFPVSVFLIITFVLSVGFGAVAITLFFINSRQELKEQEITEELLEKKEEEKVEEEESILEEYEVD